MRQHLPRHLQVPRIGSDIRCSYAPNLVWGANDGVCGRGSHRPDYGIMSGEHDPQETDFFDEDVGGVVADQHGDAALIDSDLSSLGYACEASGDLA